VSFVEILQVIVKQCGDGIGAALMGNDGIPIAQADMGAVPNGPLTDEIGIAGAEFGRVLEEIRKASDALGGGAVCETVISLARFTLIFRGVDEDTFMVLAIGPDGNLGKARYLMRRHLLAIKQEL
jgi:predicted regulator of Ras-like GTPase activity (Roadblock/LC7/MglB family)